MMVLALSIWIGCGFAVATGWCLMVLWVRGR